MTGSRDTVCPQDGETCECRPDSLSYAHCAVEAARNVDDEPEKWRLAGPLIHYHVDNPARRVTDQLVHAVRKSRR